MHRWSLQFLSNSRWITTIHPYGAGTSLVILQTTLKLEVTKLYVFNQFTTEFWGQHTMLFVLSILWRILLKILGCNLQGTCCHVKECYWEGCHYSGHPSGSTRVWSSPSFRSSLITRHGRPMDATAIYIQWYLTTCTHFTDCSLHIL